VWKNGRGCGRVARGWMVCGSGRVAVGSVDRGRQRGSNGGGLKAAVAVLTEIQRIEKITSDKKRIQFCQNCTLYQSSHNSASGSGRVTILPPSEPP
jgi:hypothetical protein